MRRLVLAFAAFSMLASCKLHKLAAVVSFEGEIDMSMGIGPTRTSSTTFKIKGAKMRTETSSLGGFASITDMDAKKTWTIDPTSRTYSEVDLAALKAASATPKSTVKAVKTRRTDTVAGHACDVYEMVDPSAPLPVPVEMCMA